MILDFLEGGTLTRTNLLRQLFDQSVKDARWASVKNINQSVFAGV
jgi:hypothetical protein